MILQLAGIASAHGFSKPALLLLRILFLLFSPCHLPEVIFHLFESHLTSLHCIKKVPKLIPLTADQIDYFQSARSCNPSSQLLRNISFSPTASSRITNLDSDQVTPPRTFHLYSANNGWKPSMSDEIRAVSLDTSCAFDSLASCRALQAMVSKANMAYRRLQRNPVISSPCQGWSAARQCSGPSPTPDLHI